MNTYLTLALVVFVGMLFLPATADAQQVYKPTKRITILIRPKQPIQTCTNVGGGITFCSKQLRRQAPV